MGVFECDLAHRQSVAVLCMLFKNRCTGYIYAPPRCRTSQCHRAFISQSVSVWNDLSAPLFDGVGLVGFKSRTNVFLFTQLLSPFLYPTVFPFSSFILWVGIVGLRSSD